MSNILLFAAAAAGVYALLDSQAQAREDELREELELQNQLIEENLSAQIEEGKITSASLTDGVSPSVAVFGISSVSDKYMNYAAGIWWENTNNEAVNVQLNSGQFTVGGYKMSIGFSDTTVITVPAQGKVFQYIGSGDNKVLWDTLAARDAVRYVIGAAQGREGKKASGLYGNATFDCLFSCTYSTVGVISNVQGDQAVISSMDARGRYYGSTALAYYMKNWISNI